VFWLRVAWQILTRGGCARRWRHRTFGGGFSGSRRVAGPVQQVRGTVSLIHASSGGDFPSLSATNKDLSAFLSARLMLHSYYMLLLPT
jgi:hypothetical protein